MCYQWVRRGGKVTGDNLGARCRVTTFNECDGGPESRPGIFPWLCRDVVARYHSFRLPSLLMGRRRLLTVSSLLVLPPQQRIQCRAAASFNHFSTETGDPWKDFSSVHCIALGIDYNESGPFRHLLKTLGSDITHRG